METELLEPQANGASTRETATGERYGVVGRTNSELLESMFGCFANDPAFERVVQFMADERARARRGRARSRR